MQSVPSEQSSYSEPGPPSSHSPSAGQLQSSVQPLSWRPLARALTRAPVVEATMWIALVLACCRTLVITKASWSAFGAFARRAIASCTALVVSFTRPSTSTASAAAWSAAATKCEPWAVNTIKSRAALHRCLWLPQGRLTPSHTSKAGTYARPKVRTASRPRGACWKHVCWSRRKGDCRTRGKGVGEIYACGGSSECAGQRREIQGRVGMEM